MGTIHIRELTGGLDKRRMPETTPGGVLIRGDDGHITRGGDFETRPAFILEGTVPPDHVGLERTAKGPKYFGSTATSVTTVPTLRYEQLNTGGAGVARIIAHAEFNGRSYVSALLTSGAMAHFYGGVRDETWVEARARSRFILSNPVVTPDTQASATFTVVGGTGLPGEYLEYIAVAGTTITNSRVKTRETAAETALAVIAAINANSRDPRFTAEIVTPGGATVRVRAVAGGATWNGKTMTWAATGAVSLGSLSAFSGAVAGVTPRIIAIRLEHASPDDAWDLIRLPVEWPGSIDKLLDNIVGAINNLRTDQEFEAYRIFDSIFVRANATGTTFNGWELTVIGTGITVAYPEGQPMAGGADLAAGTFTPADALLTVRDKLYAGSGTILHFSAIGNPTVWAAGDPPGAGFVNIGASNSSSTTITGLARYYDKLAVFTESTVQTWFIDPDPDLFQQVQVLENTGTRFSRSVTQFGDADIFYLDRSGLRSLRARDSSNAASTTDIGSPLDEDFVAKVRELVDENSGMVRGLINEDDTRFWLVFEDEIYVYSYYPNSKVNAWTRYRTTGEAGGNEVNFTISAITVSYGRVFIRDTQSRIWTLGGLGRESVYDDTVKAEAWLPYLDAGSPAAEKEWKAIDAALAGSWEIRVSYDPREPQADDLVARVVETTYGQGSIPMEHKSAFASMRFRSRGGYAKLSSAVIHFEGKINED